MKGLIQTIKSINIRQILTVFLAGCLLVISTACSQGNLAQIGGKAYTETAKRAMSDTYDDYDANQGFKGGMNGYNDDPRYNAETTAKTKALVDKAKSRQKDNLGDYAEDITDRAGDRLETTTKNASRTLQANQEKAADYIQDKSDNLKEAFDDATNTAQNAVEDATQATQKTAKEIKGNLEDLT